MTRWMRFIVLLLAAWVLLLPAVQAEELKVAFVQVSRLLTEPPQVKQVREKLKREFSRRDAELVEQQKQIKTLQDKLSRDSSIMNEDEVKRLERDILSRRLKLKNASSELQQERQLRQNEEVDRLRKIISEVIDQVARKEKLDIVLEGGVTWASDRADITDKVLAGLEALAE